MNPEDFRRIALELDGATESAHMNHPDFRVRGKIFATLNYPAKGWGMVKLTPEQQSDFMKRAPKIFAPSAGAWGKRGATNVDLGAATKTMERHALKAAWSNVPKISPSRPTR